MYDWSRFKLKKKKVYKFINRLLGEKRAQGETGREGVRCHFVTQVWWKDHSLAGLNWKHKVVELENPLPTRPPEERRQYPHTAGGLAQRPLHSPARFTPKSCGNEQNLQVIQGELRLGFLVELLEVQTPPVQRRAFAPGGHPQTPGDWGNADEETGLPGEEDRAGNHGSEEERHQKQTWYALTRVWKCLCTCVPLAKAFSVRTKGLKWTVVNV